jgi:cytosine/adenosine deaminase-related metal-dependent hydrolase
VFVNVYHGRASFELGVEIGRLQEPTEKLTLYNIVAWSGAEKAEGFGQHVLFQVSSREGVQEFVPKLAHLIQKYGTPFLNADANAYCEVHEAKSRAAVEYAKQVNLRNVRKRAEVAWHAKDYTQIVDLYGPVREDLTEVETQKLAYAEKQILSAEGVSSTSPARK